LILENYRNTSIAFLHMDTTR